MEQIQGQKAELNEEQKELLKTFEEKRKERLDEAKAEEGGEEVLKSTTIFHGIHTDYGHGKGFVEHPAYLRQREHECFIPKKWVHTWVGHNKGVSKIRFFPKFGHLMLSASHDGTCKIWDVMTHKKCLRTYMGHSKALKDICFNNDGRRFLSASFDKIV
jgi:pre-mRNA-processing factor 17